MDLDANSNLDEYEPVPDDRPESDVEDDAEGGAPADEEEGEDLQENMSADYRANSALDYYEQEGLDDEVVQGDAADEMAARRAAEEYMAERDVGAARGRKRRPDVFDEDDRLDDDDDELYPGKRMRHDGDAEGFIRVDLRDGRKGMRVEDFIAMENVKMTVKAQFKEFLTNWQDANGEKIYMHRILEMTKANRQSLEVDFEHLMKFASVMAVYIYDAPKSMLKILDEAAKEQVLKDFPEYEEIALDIYVRMTNLPLVDSLRDLRTTHLNSLVRVQGVVTRRTGVFPQLKLVKFDCMKCGYTMGPFAQNSESEVRPATCPNCQSKGPFTVNATETIYRNYQKLTLQESPGTVPPGRLPRHKEVILLNDLIDCARPGEEVDLTGIYSSGYDTSLNIKNSFPVFSTHIEANYVSKKEDLFSLYRLTDDDRNEILRLAKDPRIGERIIKSIAPSIYGYENIKAALALALFGGQEKTASAAHRLRGDINVLLLGDPGTAKSQFLKYVEKTATRAVYTTGKGASAVGLTAAVHKDPITREWTLEGGALVLADKGVCLIDEFDKMNDQDRVSIHEAMEQQSISISKAGIVTQLHARCSVMAAANPVGGRYDPSRTFTENVELTDPIISRFDVLCVVRDVVDPINDQKLAEFVVGNHVKSHPLAEEEEEDESTTKEVDPDILPQETLKKYLAYAKQYCKPTMSLVDQDRVTNVYAKLRQEAHRTHGMPIAVRHLESMIRMAEAHARMHLRQYVNEEDINMGIKIMIDSFISTQKYSVQRELRRRFKEYLVSQSDYHQVLLQLLKDLLKEEQRNLQWLSARTGNLEDRFKEIKIPCKVLHGKANEYSIPNIQSFYDSPVFTSNGFRLGGQGQDQFITYVA